MNASLLAALTDSERLLVAETEPAALAELDEDAVVELHTRIRRARGKYVGQYRRKAAAGVAKHGGRGKSRPKNARAGLKAEAFEEALARVSRRLAVLARQSAASLRTERLEAARAAKTKSKATGVAPSAKPGTKKGRSAVSKPVGDRALRSPIKEKTRGSTRAIGDRRQARRDSR